jgi:hypothetical protein
MALNGKRKVTLKRLLLITTSLCLMLMLLTAAARSRARAIAGNYNFEPSGFGDCDGLPCFLGIIPGKTKLTTAVELASERGAVYKSDEPHFTVVIDGKNVKVSAYYSEEYVDYVITSLDPPLPIDVILERYGAPCGIRIDKPEPDRDDTLHDAVIGLYFRGVSFHFRLPQWKSDQLSPHMFAYQVILEDSQLQGQYINCGSDLYGDPHTIGSPWLGFTSYRRYQQFKIKAYTQR